MRKIRMLSIIWLGLLVMPVLVVAETDQTAQEKAATQVQMASEHLATTLAALSETLPEQARAAIDKAAAASSKGFESALAALGGGDGDSSDGMESIEADGSGLFGTVTAGASEDDSPGTRQIFGARDNETEPADGEVTDEPEPGDGEEPEENELKGLEQALHQVETAFQKSVDTLSEVATKVPADTQEKILAALMKVESHRAVARDNLALLIAGERPGHAMAELPEKPQKPETPERPELPDRPETAGKPELPGRPDLPERPDKPGKPDRL